MNHFMVLAVLLALRTCYTTYSQQGKYRTIYFFIWKQSTSTEALDLLICTSAVIKQHVTCLIKWFSLVRWWSNLYNNWDFVTPSCRIACWINNLKWCKARVYLFICPPSVSSFWSVVCHCQIIYFLFYAFLPLPFTFSFFVCLIYENFSTSFGSFLIVPQDSGTTILFLTLHVCIQYKEKSKYSYSEGRKLNIG